MGAVAAITSPGRHSSCFHTHWMHLKFYCTLKLSEKKFSGFLNTCLLGININSVSRHWVFRLWLLMLKYFFCVKMYDNYLARMQLLSLSVVWNRRSFIFFRIGNQLAALLRQKGFGHLQKLNIVNKRPPYKRSESQPWWLGGRALAS